MNDTRYALIIGGALDGVLTREPGFKMVTAEGEVYFQRILNVRAPLRTGEEFKLHTYRFYTLESLSEADIIPHLIKLASRTLTIADEVPASADRI